MNIIFLHLHNVSSAAGVFLIGIMMLIVSIPLIFKKIPPNAFIGFRLPGLNLNEENWYKVNSFGGLRLLIWSIPVLVFAVLILFLPHIGSSADFKLAIVTVDLLPITIAAIQTILYAYRIR